MTADAQSARENLAFLRALVEGSGRPDPSPGKFMVVTGLAWGLDALVHWTTYVGFFGLEPLTAWQRIVFDGAVTAVWLVFAFALRWGAPKPSDAASAGAAARAYGAAAAGVGLSILAMLVVFVTAAVRIHPAVLILYPAMVFVFFGAIWLVHYFLSRRLWRLATALGWFVAAAAMVAWAEPRVFIAVAALAMLLLMALPGWLIMRHAQKEAAA